MLKQIKDFIKLFKKLKNSSVHLAWFKIVESIMNFANDVTQHGKPMLTKIAVVDMSKEKIIGDFDMVSIWAAVGDANQIERCRHLKEQNRVMKELLKTCTGLITGNEDLILNIKIVIDTFE